MTDPRRPKPPEGLLLEAAIQHAQWALDRDGYDPEGAGHERFGAGHALTLCLDEARSALDAHRTLERVRGVYMEVDTLATEYSGRYKREGGHAEGMFDAFDRAAQLLEKALGEVSDGHQ